MAIIRSSARMAASLSRLPLLASLNACFPCHIRCTGLPGQTERTGSGGHPRGRPAAPSGVHQWCVRPDAPRPCHVSRAGPGARRQPGGGAQQRRFGAAPGQGPRTAAQQRARPCGHAGGAGSGGSRHLVRRGHAAATHRRAAARPADQRRRLRHGQACRNPAGARLRRRGAGDPVRRWLLDDLAGGEDPRFPPPRSSSRSRARCGAAGASRRTPRTPVRRPRPPRRRPGAPRRPP